MATTSHLLSPSHGLNAFNLPLPQKDGRSLSVEQILNQESRDLSFNPHTAITSLNLQPPPIWKMGALEWDGFYRSLPAFIVQSSASAFNGLVLKMFLRLPDSQLGNSCVFLQDGRVASGWGAGDGKAATQKYSINLVFQVLYSQTHKQSPPFRQFSETQLYIVCLASFQTKLCFYLLRHLLRNISIIY